MTKINLVFSLSPHVMSVFWLTGSGKSWKSQYPRMDLNMTAWTCSSELSIKNLKCFQERMIIYTLTWNLQR